MNFLAHAYLSFNDKPVLAGNMISDFVKGKARYTYPLRIQHGIELHRFIDEFTDNHPCIAEAKSFFRPDYRLYSAPITDIIFDHFLARDKNIFKPEGLAAFAQNIYSALDEQAVFLPPNFATAFVYMKKQDWLTGYATTEGIEKSLAGLVRRSAFLTESNTAFHLFLMYYEELTWIYRRFFPELEKAARNKWEQLVF